MNHRPDTIPDGDGRYYAVIVEAAGAPLMSARARFVAVPGPGCGIF